MDDETKPTGGTSRRRLDSIENYYPTIEEIMASSDDEINKYLHKTKKDSIICIFKELLSQHRLTLSKNEEIADLKNTILAVGDSLQNQTPTKSQAKSFASIVKQVQSSSTNFENEIRISGVPELTSATPEKPKRIDIFEHDESNLNTVLNHLGIPNDHVASTARLGKFNPTSTRPRTMLVRFRDKFTAEKTLARASMLKTFTGTYKNEKYFAYISKSLSKEEQEKENAILRKRRDLINEGVKPENIKIRNLELIVNGVKTDYLKTSASKV